MNYTNHINTEVCRVPVSVWNSITVVRNVKAHICICLFVVNCLFVYVICPSVYCVLGGPGQNLKLGPLLVFGGLNAHPCRGVWGYAPQKVLRS